ncbi:MAG: hypothetical protein CMJ78_11690 [Planctomycetaceae bacterium]|nr:hypothetical protein [Planctomycetaceae bacterium]
MALFSFLDHLNLVEDDSSQYEVAVGDNGFSYLDLMSDKKVRAISFEEKQKRQTSAALDGSTRARGQSNLKHVESIDHDEVCLDTDLLAIIRDMEERRKKVSVFPITAGVIGIGVVIWAVLIVNSSLPTLAFLFSTILVVPGVAFALVNTWHLDRSRKDVHFTYNITGKGKVAFEALNVGLKQLDSSQQVLLNTGRRHFEDTRYTGGAASFPDLKTVQLTRSRPPLLDLEFDVWHLRAFNKDLFFMPDHVLVYDGAQMGGISYAKLQVSSDREVTQARGSARVSSDSRVVGQTYRFVNNDGSPDKRFNNNTEIPLIEYGTLALSGAGLTICLFVSNQKSAAFVPGQVSDIQDLARKPVVKVAEQRHLEAAARREARRQEVCSIVLDALCCMMFADGQASKSERKKVHELMVRIKAPWSSDETELKMRSYCSRAKEVGFISVVDDVCSRVSTINSLRQQEALVSCLERVMKADGEVTDDELRIKSRISKAIESDGD